MSQLASGIYGEDEWDVYMYSKTCTKIRSSLNVADVVIYTNIIKRKDLFV
jgi:hypothetical protein